MQLELCEGPLQSRAPHAARASSQLPRGARAARPIRMPGRAQASRLKEFKMEKWTNDASELGPLFHQHHWWSISVRALGLVKAVPAHCS